MTPLEQKYLKIKEIIQDMATEHGLVIFHIDIKSSEFAGRGLFIRSMEIVANRYYPDTIVTTMQCGTS
jgi:DNA invertase Pin-like site-specific DNA recombinase